MDTVWVPLYIRKAVYFSVVNRFVSCADSMAHASAHEERRAGGEAAVTFISLSCLIVDTLKTQMYLDFLNNGIVL